MITRDAGTDTFAKLLASNAVRFADRAAMRHKVFGIWQTWTWAQLLGEVRAYAVGLHRLGLRRGDRIAVIGANRPQLYWSMMAAQMLGAVPVPVYADAVADELAFVLAHAEVRFAAVEDQEQVDKILSVSERLATIAHIAYDEPRGLRDYDHAGLQAIAEIIADGRSALAADALLGSWLDGEIATGRGTDMSIILYTSGTTGTSKGVMLSAAGCINAASDSVAFDGLDDPTKRSPICRSPGLVITISTTPKGWWRVSARLPRKQRHGATGHPRDRLDVLFRAAARVRADAHPRHDPHGRRRPSSGLFRYFIGVAKRYGERLLNGQHVPLAGRLIYAIGRVVIYEPLKNVLGLSVCGSPIRLASQSAPNCSPSSDRLV